MMQWLVAGGILVAAIWLVPMSVRSMSHSRKGRLGSAMIDVATALDPARTLIVQEAEKRQNQDGEEAGGEDEPLPEAPKA
jgi:hypothetical protein